MGEPCLQQAVSDGAQCAAPDRQVSPQSHDCEPKEHKQRGGAWRCAWSRTVGRQLRREEHGAADVSNETEYEHDHDWTEHAIAQRNGRTVAA